MCMHTGQTVVFWAHLWQFGVLVTLHYSLIKAGQNKD